MPQESAIGITILTYNSADVLLQCIRSAKAALRGFTHKIVLVDNASSDDSAGIAERTFPDVEVIRTGANLGYAAGNNVGGRYLLGRNCGSIAFINPDVRITAKTLQTLHNVLNKHADAGCVGGVPSCSSKLSFRTTPTYLQKLLLYSASNDLPIVRTLLRGLLTELRAQHFVTLSQTQPVDVLAGPCLLFRASAYEKIGGFDEHTFLFQEEFIFAERLRQAGYRVYGCPEATYEHLGGHSTGRLGFRRQQHFINSEQHLLQAYYRWSWPKRKSMLVFRYLDWLLNTAATSLNSGVRSMTQFARRGDSTR